MDKYLLDQQESKRLFFRKITADDFNDWIEFFKSSEAMKFLFLPKMIPEEGCMYWLNLILQRYLDDKGGMMALIEKSSGVFIGQCGLLVQNIDSVEELEIGYSIIPKYWGNGFATEAAGRCKEYAFCNNFSNSLISIIHIHNEKSKHVAQRNGMSFEKQTIFKNNPVEIFRVTKNALPL